MRIVDDNEMKRMRNPEPGPVVPVQDDTQEDQFASAAARTSSAGAENEIAANQEILSQYGNIEMAADNQSRQIAHQRDIANCAAFMSAAKNGIVSPSLCGALSQTLGQAVCGGSFYKGNFVYWGLDQKTNRPVPIGMCSPVDQLRILQKANIGEAGIPMRTKLYSELARKYTRNQLESAGLQDPNGPYVAGSATFGANVPNSMNGNMTYNVGMNSGAKPGYRPRFISEDDINGRPTVDADNPGGRYRGHGISVWSTAAYEQDRADKLRREQMAYDIEMAKAKGNGLSAEDKLKLALLQEKGRNDRAAEKNKIAEAREAHRQALMKQNAAFKKAELKRNELEKEFDPEKKKKLQEELDAIMNEIGSDIVNPDDAAASGASGSAGQNAAPTLQSTGDSAVRQQQLGKSGVKSDTQSSAPTETVERYTTVSEKQYQSLPKEIQDKAKRIPAGFGDYHYKLSLNDIDFDVITGEITLKKNNNDDPNLDVDKEKEEAYRLKQKESKEKGERIKRILTGDIKTDEEAEEFIEKNYGHIAKAAMSEDNIVEWIKTNTIDDTLNSKLSQYPKRLIEHAKRRILRDGIKEFNAYAGIDRKKLGKYGLRQMIYDKYGIDIGDDAFENELLEDENGNVKSAHWYTGTSRGHTKKKGLKSARDKRLKAE